MPGQNLSFAQQLAVWLLPVLFAVTLHEVAHGYVASLLGDQTAKRLGRLSLNPIKHIDPIGTVVIPALLLYLGGFLFGWARPVPVYAPNLRHPKRDMALVAIAGPISNLVMACLWAGIAKLGLVLLSQQPNTTFATWLVLMGNAGIVINVLLAVLNLLPLPPLDGSRVISSLLPGRLSYHYDRLEPFGFFILVGLLALGWLHTLLMPPFQILYQLIASTFGLV